MVPFHGPNIDNLRKQAKTLLQAWRGGDADALRRVGAFFPNATRLGLQSAQLVLAREYGFAAGPRLLTSFLAWDASTT